MNLTRRRFLTGLAASAAALGLAACGGATATPTNGGAATTPGAGSAASPAAGGPLAKVRVGYIPVLIYSPLYLAIEKGYFREQGIEVALTSFTGGADILAQTAAGNLDVGLGGLGAAALNAFQRGLDLRVVGPAHSESPPLTTPLVVGKRRYDEGAYRTVADLRGKKVAINAKGTATEYWLQAALAHGGLSIGDIELAALPFDQVAPALTNGALDAAMLGEPLATLAERQGLIQRLANDFLTDAQGTVIFYNSRWGRDQQAPANRWLAAWLRGARDLQGGGYGRDENAAIIEGYTKTPRDVVKAASPPLHDPNGRLKLADMQAQQRYFLGSGSLTYTDLLDLNTIVDPGYAERAVQMIGRA